MSYRVIFDTNAVRNAESVSDFLGGRPELARFAKTSEILIPGIVIDEIKAQKKKHLVSKREAFLSNPFHFLRKIEEADTKNFDIDKWISDLVLTESISHTIISLTKSDCLWEMKKMCLEGTPPFEEDKEKGFKDSFLYFTVLEYLESNPEESVFVVTKDRRLKESFAGNGRVVVVENYEEFEKNTTDYFKQEYFLSTLKERVLKEITPECVRDIWLNVNDNWVLKVVVEEEEFLVEVDFSSREIIDVIDPIIPSLGSIRSEIEPGSKEKEDPSFHELVAFLVSSRSYKHTHDCITFVKKYIPYLSLDEIKNLVEASVSNPQIKRIAGDDDIKEFFMQLFDSKSEILSEDTKAEFIAIFKVK